MQGYFGAVGCLIQLMRSASDPSYRPTNQSNLPTAQPSNKQSCNAHPTLDQSQPSYSSRNIDQSNECIDQNHHSFGAQSSN